MADVKQQHSDSKVKMNFFELLAEIIGWIQIVASPLLAGCIIGFLIYISMPDKTGLVIAILVALLGLLFGIIWATKIWKKNGTINFISRISATPELDDMKKEE